MNIPAVIPDRQSLLSRCQNVHWELMQRFAAAEIALADRLGSDAPATFGAKLLRLTDRQIDKATRRRLTEARNLLAHAHVTAHNENGEWIAYWRVADRKGALDTRSFTRSSLDHWRKNVIADLDRLTQTA